MLLKRVNKLIRLEKIKNLKDAVLIMLHQTKCLV